MDYALSEGQDLVFGIHDACISHMRMHLFLLKLHIIMDSLKDALSPHVEISHYINAHGVFLSIVREFCIPTNRSSRCHL